MRSSAVIDPPNASGIRRHARQSCSIFPVTVSDLKKAETLAMASASRSENRATASANERRFSGGGGAAVVGAGGAGAAAALDLDELRLLRAAPSTSATDLSRTCVPGAEELGVGVCGVTDPGVAAGLDSLDSIARAGGVAGVDMPFAVGFPAGSRIDRMRFVCSPRRAYALFT